MLLLAPVQGYAQEQCVYETGRGPELTVDDDRTELVVNFGDWTETCVLEVGSRRPDLGFGSGWVPSWIAACDTFTTQVAFVAPQEGGEQSIVVFDGNVFYQRCSSPTAGYNLTEPSTY